MYNTTMNWLTGGRFAQSEAKCLITQLSDVTRREHAAQELVRLGADAVSPLVEALQSKDSRLLPVYEQVRAHIPSATPALIKLLGSAHPMIRGRIAEVFSISRDRQAVHALLDAVQGEYFTVRSRAELALGKIKDPRSAPVLKQVVANRGDREFHALAKEALEKIA